MKKVIVLLLGMLAVFSAAEAYELGTHARITQAAYTKSVFGTDTTLLENLGISAEDNPFGEKYYDVFGATVNERGVFDDFELKYMPLSAKPLSPSGWLMRGAIREDDLGEILGFPIGKDPHDDPYGNIFRVFNHFYDPYYDRALSYVPGAQKNPDWAIGSSNVFNDPNTPEDGRRNHFTVFDAREAMYRALTGRKMDGTNATPNASDNNPAPHEVRKAWWATTFRALGDILHLNQDMAQPQHTRNEPHTGSGGWLVDELVTGHKSVMEDYMEARALGTESFTIDDKPIEPAPLDFEPDYPVPVFSKYSDFWSTGPGGWDSLTGGGLADYSSRGFYTRKYNHGNSVYPYPSGGTLESVTLGNSVQKHLRVLVPDHYPSGKSESILMATRSAWADGLEMFGFSPKYSLTQRNYDEMAKLLLPRAVAYSAGLINHFFRGQMKIELPDEGVYGLVDHATLQLVDPSSDHVGFDKIKLKVSNSTPNGEAMTGGRIVAVLKFHRNSCYKNDLTAQPPFIDAGNCRTQVEEIVVSNPLNGGGAVALGNTPQPFEFTFPQPLPINATDVRLQVVYRGALGEEADAVVVATQDISEPTFFSYINASDYIRLNGNVYTRDQINADPVLLAQVRPTSCVDNATMQLKPACLNSFDINLGLIIGGNGKQTQVDVKIPLKRFMRIALLGDTKEKIVLAQKGTNTCAPHDPFEVEGYSWQVDYDPDKSAYELLYRPFFKVRDVPGWYGTSCIVVGDGSASGTPDNRNQGMTPIDISQPYPVQINAGNGF